MPVTLDTGFPVASRLTSSTPGATWSAFTTPGGGRLLLAFAIGNGPVARPVTSMTSPNLTWTRLTGACAVNSGSTDTVEIWASVAASVVTGEVITTTDATSPDPYWSLRSLAVFSMDGAGGIGSVNADGAAPTPSLTLSSTTAGSVALVGMAYRQGGSDIVPNASVTDLLLGGAVSAFEFHERIGAKPVSGTSVTLAWDGGPGPFSVGAVGGVEILEAGGSGGGGGNPWYYNAQQRVSERIKREWRKRSGLWVPQFAFEQRAA